MISRFYSSVAVGITMFAFHCNKNLEVIVVSSAGTVTRGCMYAVYMNYISYPKKNRRICTDCFHARPRVPKSWQLVLKKCSHWLGSASLLSTCASIDVEQLSPTLFPIFEPY